MANEQNNAPKPRPWSVKSPQKYKDGNGQEQTRWADNGVAWPSKNGKGGFDLTMDSWPANTNRLSIFPPKTPEQQQGQQQGGSQGPGNDGPER